jgi:hypothetical protein
VTATRSEASAERNQRALVGQLGRVYAALNGEPADAAAEPADGTQMDRLVGIFQLSPFERDILLWCAGTELDARFATGFAQAFGDPRRTQPTFGLALARLDNAHWDALSPGRPLRRWRLLELAAGVGLVDRPLQIDERILHYLTGVVCLEPRLYGLLEPDEQPLRLAPAHRHAVGDLVTLLDRLVQPATLLVDGSTAATRRRVAGHVAAEIGRRCLVLRAAVLQAPGVDPVSLARLVEREVALLDGLLYLEVGDDADASAVDGFVGRLACPVLVGGTARVTSRPTPIRRTLPDLGTADRLELWREALGPVADGYGPVLAEVAEHFRFDAAGVEAVCAQQKLTGHDPQELPRACRAYGRGGLEELAQHIPPLAGWDDLVLPEAAMESLLDLARQARHRTTVYGDWGMATESGRGLGITALFTGDSGTGKTLAAEILASTLDLDLYRIDLASVVSKYIGETEKNLKRVFDAAEASGAVLLFDEADALFGKRSEVKDSHDRYANVEVAYLLQRMEAYRGLAILTTNLKTALDRAFLRRIRFLVTFPFPTEPLRQAIWQRQFPPTVPTDGLHLARLAQLQVPGGNIRAIALSAAFLAAASGGPLRMSHVLQAARREYAKLEKPLTDAEVRGWT